MWATISLLWLCPCLSQLTFYTWIVDDEQGESKLCKLKDQKITDNATILNEVSNSQHNPKKYQVITIAGFYLGKAE